jgi:hypothetical protein
MEGVHYCVALLAVSKLKAEPVARLQTLHGTISNPNN